MMTFTNNPSRWYSQPVVDLIQQRFSCRTFRREVLDKATRLKLENFASQAQIGPLGHAARFELVAASEQDPHHLRSLGTYGFISGAKAYLVGAMPRENFSPEDYGYLLEQIILYATDLGLGTCWLGGTFTKSSFARKIDAQPDEIVPAVSPAGYPARKPRRIETWLKGRRATRNRLPWTELFFERDFGELVLPDQLDGYRTVLEMVRLGPSASNRQPWRLVHDGKNWHFYLQRTPGYQDKFLTRWTTVADLQRIDMGIAMCHFELTALALGLNGHWRKQDPQIAVPDQFTEYVVTWQGDN